MRRHGIEEEIRELEDRKRRLERERDSIDLSCHHEWGDVEYTPTEHGGYMCPGDPPGTMGVDRQLPFYVEKSTKRQWTRVCKKCGKVETTTHVKTKKEFNYSTGTYSDKEYPIFYGDH